MVQVKKAYKIILHLREIKLYEWGMADKKLMEINSQVFSEILKFKIVW